ncbi:MAG: hypothetical protein K1000chlam3_01423 [Chlamydiae bacterium]|nr:hypothetical protein [Chlamydiota bacterium]
MSSFSKVEMSPLLGLRTGEAAYEGEDRNDPINKKGERVTPVAWEQGCLEVVCGYCSMLVRCKGIISELLRCGTSKIGSSSSKEISTAE